MTAPQRRDDQAAAVVRPLRPEQRGIRPDPLRGAWAADDLMATEFPPPRWAVPGVLCEGVNLFCGPPKVGKSWMALGLGLSIASGRAALGTIDVDPGPVLYLALEDTPRRLKSRMGRVLAGQPAPSGLTLVTECPPLPQGGDAAIAGWLDRNPTARMVVIDVFAKMRGHNQPGASAYDADYAAVGRVKRLADHYGVAFLLVHHVRKAAAEDFLAEVSGTNGLAGAADATLILKRARNQADGVLSVTGRDVEEAEYALRFEQAHMSWEMLDATPDEYALGDTRRAILTCLRRNPGLAPKAVADIAGIPPDTARKTCVRMAEDGQLTTDGTGHYYAPMAGTATAPGGVPAVPPVPQPLFSQVNHAETEGHPEGHPASAVPHRPTGGSRG
jgi:hypothetical protein